MTNFDKFGFKHISEVNQIALEKINQYRKGELKPYRFWSKKLNDVIGGIVPGDQIIIAGRTGSGKSAFAQILIKHLAKTYDDLLILYWSFEMKDYQNIVRFYSNSTKTTVKELLSVNYPLSDSVYQNLVEISKEYSNYNIYFRDIPADTNEWANIVDKICTENKDKKIVNVIDHTRLVKANNEKTEEERITSLANKGIALKNKHECINIFLSQLNRRIEEGDRKDVGKNGLLISYIFGSDGIAQSATLILGIHRPETYGLLEYGRDKIPTEDLLIVQVLKAREGEICDIAMKHNLSINQINDA